MALVVVQGGSCADWYENEVFVRTFSGIQHVPDDIPPRAREVLTSINTYLNASKYTLSPYPECRQGKSTAALTTQSAWLPQQLH